MTDNWFSSTAQTIGTLYVVKKGTDYLFPSEKPKTRKRTVKRRKSNKRRVWK